MRFADPIWLGGLWAVPALFLLLVWAAARRRGKMRRIADAGLARRLSREVSVARRAWSAVFLLLGVAALALAAARPQFGTHLTDEKRRGIDLVVAVDASNSMMAEDYKPNRLDRARRELVELLTRLQGDRVGLVAFAGKAVTLCPLTLDYGAVALLLGAVSTESVPEQGTALAEAVRTSLREYVQKETKYKALLLLTDGEDHEGDLDAAAEEARHAGVKIFAVGIGSAAGEPIPIRDAQDRLVGYKKDGGGQVVMSRLDEAPLQKLASATGGAYFRAGQASFELDRVVAAIEGQEKKELSSGRYTEMDDQFHWFAGAALLLLAISGWLGERRSGTGRRGPDGRSPSAASARRARAASGGVA